VARVCVCVCKMCMLKGDRKSTRYLEIFHIRQCSTVLPYLE